MPIIRKRLSLRVEDANQGHVTVSLFDDGGKAGELKMTPLGFATLTILFDCDADTYRGEPEKYMGKTYEVFIDW